MERLRLFGLELDGLENHRLSRQLGLARGKFVGCEHERKNVGVHLAAETSRRVLRHRDTDALEEIAEGEAVPPSEELAARKTRGHLTAGQFRSVAGPALFRVEIFSARRLCLGIRAVPDRFGRRLSTECGLQNQHRDDGYKDNSKTKFHGSIMN